MSAIRKCLAASIALSRRYSRINLTAFTNNCKKGIGSTRTSTTTTTTLVVDLSAGGGLVSPHPSPWDEYGDTTDPGTATVISTDLLVYMDFVSEEEERSLLDEVEPHLKRLKYEENHWDDAILGYRETERKNWTQKNKGILERVKQLAFSPDASLLPYVHVLDLKASGVIKPHVDSVKFCGSTIAGICLLSSAVMRLVNEREKSLYADVLLSRRSLYIMRDRARYDYTHEVLGEESSKFKGAVVPRERRIAVIMRNEP